MIVEGATGGRLQDVGVIAATAHSRNVGSNSGRTLRATIVFLATLVCCLFDGASSSLSARAACASDLICYDEKVTYDQVIWAISNVFKSHGYEVEQTPGIIVVNQGGAWVQLPSTIVRYVKTAWQGSSGWRYVAEVQLEGSTVALQVVQKIPKQNRFGVLVDEAPYGWQPPDMNSIRNDIRERLRGE